MRAQRQRQRPAPKPISGKARIISIANELADPEYLSTYMAMRDRGEDLRAATTLSRVSVTVDVTATQDEAQEALAQLMGGQGNPDEIFSAIDTVRMWLNGIEATQFERM
jgi:hypothetical protein